MRLMLLACMALSLTNSVSQASDIELMVGFRSVLANFIQDEGFDCPDVKRLTHLGLEGDGSVAQVFCGRIGSAEISQGAVFRVIFFTGGGVAVSR